MLRGQAQREQLPTVQLYSAKAGMKAIRKGEHAQFMIVRAPDADCPRRVDSTQGAGTVVHDQPNNPALALKQYALLVEYADIFEQPGKPVSRLVDHHIDLIDTNAVPPKLQLYQRLEDELIITKDTIDGYLTRGWIKPSSGSYGTPIIVIRKNTGELCIVIDYQLLNKQTKWDLYPIPHIDELLYRFAHAEYFSKIDLESGYHQIKIADGREEKTMFFAR